MVELATMPDLPTRVHLDSLCSIAGCVESYSRTHTVAGVVAGSSSASGWGGTSAGSVAQDWSQPPPGLSQTTGACWDCARGLCLRLDHGSTSLSSLKVSNTPAHSAMSGDQGNPPVHQSAGVIQGTSTATQGSLLDLILDCLPSLTLHPLRPSMSLVGTLVRPSLTLARPPMCLSHPRPPGLPHQWTLSPMPR